MKEFKGFISEDGLKIGTKQDVLDYEESLKIPKLIDSLCDSSSYSYNSYAGEFQIEPTEEDIKRFLTNKFVVELFYLFNWKLVETITVNETQGTIGRKRSYETK